MIKLIYVLILIKALYRCKNKYDPFSIKDSLDNLIIDVFYFFKDNSKRL
jgi:hypothetical protein